MILWSGFVQIKVKLRLITKLLFGNEDILSKILFKPKLMVATLLIAFFVCNPVKSEILIKGGGTESCSQLISNLNRARFEFTQQYKQWVNGFISGLNQGTNRVVSQNISEEAIFAAVEKHCRNRSFDTVYQASLKIYNQLLDQVSLDDGKADLNRGQKARDEKRYNISFPIFDKLARSGNLDAQFELSMAYMIGQGVRKNIFKAYMWMLIYSLQGGEDGKLLAETFGSNLSSDDRELALVLAHTCRKTGYSNCDL